MIVFISLLKKMKAQGRIRRRDDRPAERQRALQGARVDVRRSLPERRPRRNEKARELRNRQEAMAA
jgi:hypothetical protein